MQPLFVRVSGNIGRLGISGYLGLHFLKQFSIIHFEQSTDTLTLTYETAEF